MYILAMEEIFAMIIIFFCCINHKTSGQITNGKLQPLAKSVAKMCTSHFSFQRSQLGDFSTSKLYAQHLTFSLVPRPSLMWTKNKRRAWGRGYLTLTSFRGHCSHKKLWVVICEDLLHQNATSVSSRRVYMPSSRSLYYALGIIISFLLSPQKVLQWNR